MSKNFARPLCAYKKKQIMPDVKIFKNNLETIEPDQKHKNQGKLHDTI